MSALVPAAMSVVPPRKPPAEIALDYLPQIPIGVTLRDLFAAFAMAGWVASEGPAWSPSSIANKAYEQADAMLSRRTYTKAH